MNEIDKNKEEGPRGEMNLWRSVFLAMILGVMTLIVSLSIFFYIRSRESVWDNRSGVSRLIVVNKNSTKQFGTETFTMFGSSEITLNGSTISDENTMYIADGGIILLEVSGLSRGELTGAVSTYNSRILVNRKSVTTVTPLDGSGSNLSPTEVEISPITGADGTVRIKLDDSRIELRGSWNTLTNPIRNYALKVEVVGWYP